MANISDFISAGDEGGASALRELTDVSPELAVNGDILVYDEISDRWVPGSTNPIEANRPPLYAFPEPPTITIAMPVFNAAGDAVTITATGVDPDGDDTTLTYAWVATEGGMIGMGAATNEIVATANGTFTVTVTDVQGLEASESIGIALIGTGPDITLTAPATATEGDSIMISFTATDSDGTINFFCLDAVNAAGTVTNIVTDTTVPTSPVTHTVLGDTALYRLTVRDNNNFTTIVEDPIMVTPSLLSITGYTVTPESASGTASTTLTHTVTGNPGAEFTFSASGGGVAPSPTSAVIPAGGTYTDTSTQGAQGNNAAARTLNFRVENDNESTQFFTDTVSQGAGPTATAVTQSSSRGTLTVSAGGSQHAGYTATVSGSVTIANPSAFSSYTFRVLGFDIFGDTNGDGTGTFVINGDPGITNNITINGTPIGAFTTAGSNSNATGISIAGNTATVAGSFTVPGIPTSNDDPTLGILWSLSGIVANGFTVNGDGAGNSERILFQNARVPRV